ncbi:hypothetical protein COEREDRAFT_97513 [Coemansia reversa NRRL 1564]|uniref:Uncharacterized protein n=1 Tax=Coemansia reversa (strain ATCC 12441 / NRRL 1564) TaxID=763665 RepID=A0A2G5BBE6_COERN|nr:hypothetical protein COEREDRAFT_97513 [Coemansia reversa NRRL 1564]|eukprot:PIA16335.1 hypothetical protein COEREDRAFT_97513 [Coemansia reversa NRRL 1564]
MGLVCRSTVTLRGAYAKYRVASCPLLPYLQHLDGRKLLHTCVPAHNSAGGRRDLESDLISEEVSSTRNGEEKTDAKDDAVRSLESIFDLLDFPEKGSSTMTGSRQPPREGHSRDNRAMDWDRNADSNNVSFDDLLSTISQSGNRGSERSKKPSKARFDNYTKKSDDGLDAMFSAMDEDGFRGSSERRQRSPSNQSGDPEDPMQEFERILADMADNETQAYKQSRPAPLFWDEDAINKEHGSTSSFIADLGPKSLFERGPRASAFSAGKLQGDENTISEVAARVQRISRKAQKSKERKQSHEDGVTAESREQSKADRKLERIQLSKLTSCRSVVTLSEFVINDLFSRKASAAKGLQKARPSSAVYTEVVKMAREYNAPSLALYVYNHCCTRLGLADRLRVLDGAMYSELLATRHCDDGCKWRTRAGAADRYDLSRPTQGL